MFYRTWDRDGFLLWTGVKGWPSRFRHAALLFILSFNSVFATIKVCKF